MYDALVSILQKSADIVLGYGLQGVVIVALVYVCNNLWNKYCEIQEKRIMEANAQTTALNANTAALTRISDALLRGSN